MTRALLGGLAVLFVSGLVASAYVPGAEQLLDRLAVGAVVLLVVGWVTHHAVGEVRLMRELRRPPKAPPPGWRTALVRVDPVTGQPWREPATVECTEAEVSR